MTFRDRMVNLEELRAWRRKHSRQKRKKITEFGQTIRDLRGQVDIETKRAISTVEDYIEEIESIFESELQELGVGYRMREKIVDREVSRFIRSVIEGIRQRV